MAGLTRHDKETIISLYHLNHQQPQRNRNPCRNQSWHHERMVEHIFADVRRSRAVEVDGGDDGRVVGDKKIAVDGGEKGNQHVRRDAERDT